MICVMYCLIIDHLTRMRLKYSLPDCDPLFYYHYLHGSSSFSIYLYCTSLSQHYLAMDGLSSLSNIFSVLVY